MFKVNNKDTRRTSLPAGLIATDNYPANIYLFKVNGINNRKWCETRLKLTKKTVERRHWRHSSVLIVNFEHISNLFLMFPLSTLNK